MSKAIQLFNGLNGTIATRNELNDIIEFANQEEQTHISEKLQTLLDSYDCKKFDITLRENAVEIVPKSMLNGLDFDEFNEDDIQGLNKAVSPNDIYQMITDKMLAMIKEASGKGYITKWKGKKYGKGYLIPFNFDSKKRYRGVNNFLLTNIDEPLKNPFFLTFKQIEKHGGKLKKGSKGQPVVYFTKLYKVTDKKRDIDFGTYDLKKAKKFVSENGLTEDKITFLPILKYYNVFNGADIDGIDFDLDNFKVGYIERELPATETLPIPEAIIKNYPAPKPPLKHGANRAYYSPSSDYIKMPHIADFDTIQDYYRTLFHEFAHSTGNHNRLKRDFTGRFGSKKYAFEELIAEWGATFLSAEAGIIFHNNKNHAEYIKNWNAALTHIKDDNRFIMRACTKAQELCDFILQFENDGNPKYLKDIEVSEAKKETDVQTRKKPAAKTSKTSTKSTTTLEKPTRKLSRKPKTNKRVKETNLVDENGQIGLFGASTDLETIAFNKELMKAIKKGVKNTDGFVLGKPKGILKDYVDDFQISLSGKVLQKAIAGTKDHNLNFGNFIDLPDYLNNPVAIFKSKTKGFVILTEIKDVNNKPVIVALHIDKAFKTSKIASMYVRENDNTYKNWIKEKLHLYVNKKSDLFPFTQATIAVGGNKSHSKDTKKSNSSVKKTKKGLSEPTQKIDNDIYLVDVKANSSEEWADKVVEEVINIIEEKPKPKVANGSKAKSIRNIGQTESEFFTVNGEVGKFLQAVERKPKQSVVITMDGEQGAGKTTTLYKFMDAFASAGNSSLFLSLEEHHESSLAVEKRDNYLSDAAQDNLAILSEVATKEELYKEIENYDIIFLDSWQKLQRMIGQIRLDEDLRKKFDGKVFVIIFQQTTTGRTKGGSEVVFDGDIIIKMVKENSFANNYAYFDKNRYTKVPIETIRYNIASGKAYNPQATETQPEEIAIEPVAEAESIEFSFEVN